MSELLNVRPMTEEDMIMLMEQNLEHYPEYAKLNGEQRRFLVQLNLKTGDSISVLEKDKIVLVGGIRYMGVGEAWSIASPDFMKSVNFFRNAKFFYEDMRQRLNMWRMFAENKISANYLKHLGFEKSDIYLWTRTNWE